MKPMSCYEFLLEMLWLEQEVISVSRRNIPEVMKIRAAKNHSLADFIKAAIAPYRAISRSEVGKKFIRCAV